MDRCWMSAVGAQYPPPAPTETPSAVSSWSTTRSECSPARPTAFTGHDPERVAFVQADLFDLPFQVGSFATVAYHGLLHLFEDPAAPIGALRAQLTPTGSLYATSLVAETAVGG